MKIKFFPLIAGFSVVEYNGITSRLSHLYKLESVGGVDNEYIL